MTPAPDNYKTVAEPPPAVTLTRAMLWHWWIVLASVVVCVAVAVGAALLRNPEYTATTKLAIAGIDISAPGALSGYATATESLAAGYSRTVTALAVAKPVSEETGITVKGVQEHVTATPIKESPVFRIEATSPDSDQAIALANLSARSLMRYAAKLNETRPDTDRLYDRYREALIDRKQAKQQLNAAREDAAERETPAAEEEVNVARAEVEAASLRADAIGQAYTLSVQGETSTRLIQVISPATSAVSDRRSTFIVYVVIGFVAGLLVGAALAFVRESRLSADSSY